MSASLPPSAEIRNETANASAALPLLDVRNVSKRYHLWSSPRARLIYGFWSQIPRWAPAPLLKIAQKRKAELGPDFYALENVSLQLGRGESLAILGRNGSGKSTLLQIICGTLQPSAGSVVRNCRRVAALLELGSGFNPDFTGRENVFLNGAVLGLHKEQIETKFNRILEFAEIGEFVEQPVKTYSSGMMLRLAFAVQVLLEPELLIVDEALAVGDIFFQQKCFAYMRQLKEKGCSFLIVSHDTHSIQQLCDRAIVLIDGRKHFEGISGDAIREYYLTEKVLRAKGPPVAQTVQEKLSVEASDGIEEPECWFEPKGIARAANAPAALTRWSCADESGKVTDQFSSGQKVRLFVEFECTVSVGEGSAGFAIRDKIGQVIHGKHQYQIGSRAKIKSESNFLLQCEFSFVCRLAPGQYTIEFGLVDIGVRPSRLFHAENEMVSEEFFEVLCHPPPVGKFAVISKTIDPINRSGHFGIVDIEAESRFRVQTSPGA